MVHQRNHPSASTDHARGLASLTAELGLPYGGNDPEQRTGDVTDLLTLRDHCDEVIVGPVDAVVLTERSA